MNSMQIATPIKRSYSELLGKEKENDPFTATIFRKLKIDNNDHFGSINGEQNNITSAMRAAFSEVVKEGIEKLFLSNRKQETAKRSQMKQKAEKEETMKIAVEFAKNHTNVETAKKYKVSESTIRRWKDKFPESEQEKENIHEKEKRIHRRKSAKHAEMEVRIFYSRKSSSSVFFLRKNF